MPLNRQYLPKAFYMLLALLIGFLSGNLFGTILPFVRIFFRWDGFIIAALLVVIECLSYISYRSYRSTKKNRRFDLLRRKNKNLNTEGVTFGVHTQHFKSKGFKLSTLKGLSFFKIGVMIGFFVDAFKVGS